MVERHQFGVDQVVGDKAGKYIIFIKSNLYIYIYIYIFLFILMTISLFSFPLCEIN